MGTQACIEIVGDYRCIPSIHTPKILGLKHLHVKMGSQALIAAVAKHFGESRAAAALRYNDFPMVEAGQQRPQSRAPVPCAVCMCRSVFACGISGV